MEFKTPLEIHQRNLGMDLTVEEIEAACAIARKFIAKALDEWRDESHYVRAKIVLPKPKWLAIEKIISDELAESGWEIERWSSWSGTEMAEKTSHNQYILVDIEPLVDNFNLKHKKAFANSTTGSFRKAKGFIMLVAVTLGLVVFLSVALHLGERLLPDNSSRPAMGSK